jgi:tRNA threonylcarbamoyladenosine dehydratase
VTSHEDSPAAQGATVHHTLSNGKQVELPRHEEFYAAMITRNRGLVPEEEQQALRKATILVAGCGSVGGAVIEPLVRFGAEHLILAEPDGYDLHNLNRQSARIQDIGRNKAETFQERMHDINPYAEIEVAPHGITDENARPLVSRAGLIVDAVDVTTRPPLRAKYLLHKMAKEYRVPIVAGYDVAGLQLMIVYDYRKSSTKIFHGRVREEDIDTVEPMVFLRRVVPLAAIPFEMIGELGRQIRGERSGFPQIVYTADLFGVLVLPAMLSLLANRPVRTRVIVDVPTLVRPLPTRLRVATERLYRLYKLNNEFKAAQRAKATAGKPATEH